MKNFHGLNRARGYGLKSMSRQAKLTALAVNLKRIASILSSLKLSQLISITIFLKKLDLVQHFQVQSYKKMDFSVVSDGSLFLTFLVETRRKRNR